MKRFLTSLFFPLSLFLIFNSCGLVATFKVQDAFENEQMDAYHFKKQLPFRYQSGLIIVEMEVEGIKGNFAMDTGAVTIFDDDFAKNFKHKTIGKIKSKDTNNKKRKKRYVKTNELKVADISFHEIVASISNLDKLSEAACLDIVGILGVNLMNKAIWQIDYSKQIITITDSRDSLNLSGENNPINFVAYGKGVPILDLYSNKKYLGELLLDTGSNGHLSLPLEKKPIDLPSLNKHSINYGVHSAKERNTHITILPQIRLGQQFGVSNQVTSFVDGDQLNILGNKFLQNYLVTIDWISQQLILSPSSKSKEKLEADFGFTIRLFNKKIVIGSIYEETELYKKGVRINDEVLQINDLDFSKVDQDSYCQGRALFNKNDIKELFVTTKKDMGTLTINAKRTSLLKLLE